MDRVRLKKLAGRNRAQPNPDTTLETPQVFYDTLDSEFHFGWDACALSHSAKAPGYFGPDHDVPRFRDALAIEWPREFGPYWMNPEYGGVLTPMWLHKAYVQVKKNKNLVVALVQSNTDTGFFHHYLMKAHELRFVKGRLEFLRYNHKTGEKVPAGDGSNFSNVVAVFRPEPRQFPYPIIKSINKRGEENEEHRVTIDLL